MLNVLRARGRDERGGVLVLLSLSLTVIIGFAAIVIDGGNARQFRLQAQAAADASALAGVQELVDRTVPSTTRLERLVAAIKDYGERNLGIPPADWSGCLDPEAPAELSVLPDLANGDECISVDAAMTRVRVKLPTQTADTFLGQLLGRESFDVGAVATAQAGPSRTGRVLPIGVTLAAGTGNLCIENSGNDTACAIRTTGNFGALKSPRLVRFITDHDNDALELNLAMGIDHEIVAYAADPKVCDGDLVAPCDTANTITGTANYMNSETGNTTNEPANGFVEGFSGFVDGFSAIGQQFCGRLERPEYTPENLYDPRPNYCAAPAAPTMDLLGHTINGRHVAYWMTPAAKAVFYPLALPNLQTVGNVAYVEGDLRLACFIAGYRLMGANEVVPDCSGVGLATPATRPLFRKEIVNDPRFGWIPVLEAWPSGGSDALRVVDFQAIYLYRLYATNSKVKAVDAWVFDPGLVEGGPSVFGSGGADLGTLGYLVD